MGKENEAAGVLAKVEEWKEVLPEKLVAAAVGDYSRESGYSWQSSILASKVSMESWRGGTRIIRAGGGVTDLFLGWHLGPSGEGAMVEIKIAADKMGETLKVEASGHRQALKALMGEKLPKLPDVSPDSLWVGYFGATRVVEKREGKEVATVEVSPWEWHAKKKVYFGQHFSPYAGGTG